MTQAIGRPYPRIARAAPQPRALNLWAMAIALAGTAWAPNLFAPPGGMSWFHVLAVGLFLLLASRSIRIQPALDPVQNSISRGMFIAAGFIAFWAILSAFQAEDPARVGRPVAAFLMGPILFFVLNRLVPPHRIDNLIEWQFYCAAASTIACFAAIYVPPLRAFIYEDGDRAQAFFKHSNQFAMALSTIAPVLLAKLLSDTRRRLLWGVLLVLVILGFVLAGSKANTGIALGAMLLLALFGALTHRSAVRSLVFLLFFVLLGMLGLIVAWKAVVAINPRMAGLLATIAAGEEIASVAGRITIWSISLREFYADPLFGQGGGALLSVYFREGDVSHSHNVILDQMRTLGVPGLIAILSFTVMLVALSIYQFVLAIGLRTVDRFERMKLVGLSLGMLSYYIANMSSDSFGPSTSPIFWMVFAIGLWQGRKVIALSAHANSPSRPVGPYRTA